MTKLFIDIQSFRDWCFITNLTAENCENCEIVKIFVFNTKFSNLKTFPFSTFLNFMVWFVIFCYLVRCYVMELDLMWHVAVLCFIRRWRITEPRHLFKLRWLTTLSTIWFSLTCFSKISQKATYFGWLWKLFHQLSRRQVPEHIKHDAISCTLDKNS